MVNKWLDLLDRAGWTFVESFAAAVLLLDGAQRPPTWTDVKIGFGAAVIAVLKFVAVRSTQNLVVKDTIRASKSR